MWSQLVELQPQTGGDAGGISREEFIGKIAADIQSKLPPVYDVGGIRKKMGQEITPTSVVLLQELDRFNVLIKKMFTTLMNLQRVSNQKVKLPFDSFQPSVVFHIETSHLFCSAKQMTGFYMKHNTWLK